VRGLQSKACLGKNARPYLKNKIKQNGPGHVQVVEYLPSKLKALIIISSTTKKRKKHFN
jgi:hypothetical protein